MGFFVYKYVLENEIIYIGKCNGRDLRSRLSEHGKEGDNLPEEFWDDINVADIYYVELVNSTMTDVVESELVRRYKPKCNNDYKKHKLWKGLPFKEPEWTAFDREALKPKAKKYGGSLISEETQKRASIAYTPKEITVNEIKAFFSGAVFRLDDNLLWMPPDRILEPEHAEKLVSEWDSASKKTKKSFITLQSLQDEISKAIPVVIMKESKSSYGSVAFGIHEKSNSMPVTNTCFLPRIDYVINYLTDLSDKSFELIKIANSDSYKEQRRKC